MKVVEFDLRRYGIPKGFGQRFMIEKYMLNTLEGNCWEFYKILN